MANGSNLPETKKNGGSVEQMGDPGNALMPDVDIIENAEGLTLYVDLPGVAQGGVELALDENYILTLKAKNAFREPEGKLLAQADVADYFRAFQLGSEYDRGLISAQFRDGVLTLRIPRREDAKPRRVEIKV
jgi:HSP20 family molecular chaperone IbpA